jgi:hypothetical protein
MFEHTVFGSGHFFLRIFMLDRFKPKPMRGDFVEARSRGPRGEFLGGVNVKRGTNGVFG